MVAQQILRPLVSSTRLPHLVEHVLLVERQANAAAATYTIIWEAPLPKAVLRIRKAVISLLGRCHNLMLLGRRLVARPVLHRVRVLLAAGWGTTEQSRIAAHVPAFAYAPTTLQAGVSWLMEAQEVHLPILDIVLIPLWLPQQQPPPAKAFLAGVT